MAMSRITFRQSSDGKIPEIKEESVLSGADWGQQLWFRGEHKMDRADQQKHARGEESGKVRVDDPGQKE